MLCYDIIVYNAQVFAQKFKTLDIFLGCLVESLSTKDHTIALSNFKGVFFYCILTAFKRNTKLCSLYTRMHNPYSPQSMCYCQ